MHFTCFLSYSMKRDIQGVILLYLPSFFSSSVRAPYCGIVHIILAKYLRLWLRHIIIRRKMRAFSLTLSSLFFWRKLARNTAHHPSAIAAWWMGAQMESKLSVKYDS